MQTDYYVFVLRTPELCCLVGATSLNCCFEQCISPSEHPRTSAQLNVLLFLAKYLCVLFWAKKEVVRIQYGVSCKYIPSHNICSGTLGGGGGGKEREGIITPPR